MKPVDMAITHDPENGRWGDCFRACIASMLELPTEDVPHFFFDGEAPDGFEDDPSAPGWRRLQAFLGTQTPPLAALGLRMDALDQLDLYETFLRENVDCHYLVGGLTDCGTSHIVVCHRGVMVHDPHPARKGLLADAFPKDLIFLVRK